MKVGKLVVILLLVGFVALAGKMLFGDKPQGNMQAGYTPPRQTQPFSRADDPTYAEEVKGFSSLLQAQKDDITEATKKEIEKLRIEAQGIKQNFDSQLAEREQAYTAEKKALIEKVESLSSQLGEQSSTVKKELEQMGKQLKEGAVLTSGEIENLMNRAKDKIMSTTGPGPSETGLSQTGAEGSDQAPIGQAGVPIIDITPKSGQNHDGSQNTGGSQNPGGSRSQNHEGAQDPFNQMGTSTGQSSVFPTHNGRVSIRPYGMTGVAEDTKPGDLFSNISGVMSGLNPFGSKTSTSSDSADLGGGGMGGGLSFEKSDSGNPFATKVSAGGAKYSPIPMYTIPDTATLVINGSMTPLIGRVPNRASSVPDPFRFKLITGADNLATNGLRIPGIDNIVWTGWAIGVRENSCVRGYIDTITYTFQDGRIQTITSGKSKGGSSNQNLGYITDPWGKPCIRGTLISNASDYLMDRGGAAFLAAIAEAAAASQVTVQSNSDGSMSQLVTGNTGEFVASKGVSGVAKEIADYVRERSVNAFDVVYVPSGIQVQLFVEQQINIDYDPNGRKLAYDYTTTVISDNKLD